MLIHHSFSITVAVASIYSRLVSAPDASMDAVLQGSWTLVDLHVQPGGLLLPSSPLQQQQQQQPSEDILRYQAVATFCHVDWSIHQQDPSQVSFFADLHNEACNDDEMVQVDLFDFVQSSRDYDRMNPDRIKNIPPTGVIFHESRCGSTLAANMLASFAPERTRVYSEHFPPITALRACAETECNDSLHQQLIKDVYYVLGRTARQDNIDYVFYKSNSGGMFIDKFTAAFPDTPWTFMYRDSAEILQSHWKLPEEQMDPTKDVPCARHYANPNQPPAIREVLLERNVTHTNQITKTQYCAAHLAGISRSVMQEHLRTGRGRFINYKEMPQVIWETLLPLDFGVTLDEDMKNKMMQVTRRYSKGGKRDQRFTGGTTGSDEDQQRIPQEQWTEDTTKKRALVSPAIMEAVHLFCPDIYNQLETVASQQPKDERPGFRQEEGTNQRWNTIRGIGPETIEEGTTTTNAAM